MAGEYASSQTVGTPHVQPVDNQQDVVAKCIRARFPDTASKLDMLAQNNDIYGPFYRSIARLPLYKLLADGFKNDASGVDEKGIEYFVFGADSTSGLNQRRARVEAIRNCFMLLKSIKKENWNDRFLSQVIQHKGFSSANGSLTGDALLENTRRLVSKWVSDAEILFAEDLHLVEDVTDEMVSILKNTTYAAFKEQSDAIKRALANSAISNRAENAALYE